MSCHDGRPFAPSPYLLFSCNVQMELPPAESPPSMERSCTLPHLLRSQRRETHLQIRRSDLVLLLIQMPLPCQKMNMISQRSVCSRRTHRKSSVVPFQLMSIHLTRRSNP